MPAKELKKYANPLYLIIEKNNEIYEVIPKKDFKLSFVFDTIEKRYPIKVGIDFMIRNNIDMNINYSQEEMELLLYSYDGKEINL